ncbi:MAG: hypothetical protein ACTSSK_09105, partial [Candidatus Heimdallarchaeota archaeon]
GASVYSLAGIPISHPMQEALLNIFLYFIALLISGLVIGVITYRKDGYKILGILAPLAMFGSTFYVIYDFYSVTTPSIDMQDVYSLAIIGPGVVFVFIGCFLGILIKYKAQKGANFTMDLLEKIKKV